jgi:ribose transport system permease protein
VTPDASSEPVEGPPSEEGARRAAPWPRVLQRFSIRSIGAVYVWLVLIAIFAIWIPDLFVSSQTAKSILNQYSITALATLSLVIPLATGLFDLSIGAAMGLTGIVAGWLLGNTSLNPVIVVALALLVGLGVGVFNSIVVVGLSIDSFIGTLATGAILSAITIGISGDQILTDRVAGSFSKIASVQVHGFDLPVLYMLALMLAIGFLLEQTPVGRYFYAIGYNPDVTRLVGVNVRSLRVLALLCSGTLAGFAGIVLTARIQAADPTNGSSYLIPAFSSAFLGATQFRHGRFNPWGAIVAVLMLGTGSVGLLLAGAPDWSPQVFQGAVLIAAVGITVAQRRPKASA